LIIWGMFKKVVIADSLAPIVDGTFNNYQDFGGGTLWMGAIYFGFQIYCDFSGYSDIAIGTSKLFGFELMSNFKFPYFSRNIGEFWRRWHISLSTWFRDYLYIPLGGSKHGKLRSIRNIFVIFLVSGFWHGANWTFIVWGVYHSILFLPSFLFNTNRNYTSSIIGENSFLPTLKELLQVGITFLLVSIGWVFFRSENINNSFKFLNQIFTDFSLKSEFEWLNIYLLCFIIIEFLIRKNERLKEKYFNYDWIVFSILMILILDKFGSISNFIYFQF